MCQSCLLYQTRLQDCINLCRVQLHGDGAIPGSVEFVHRNTAQQKCPRTRAALELKECFVVCACDAARGQRIRAIVEIHRTSYYQPAAALHARLSIIIPIGAVLEKQQATNGTRVRSIRWTAEVC